MSQINVLDKGFVRLVDSMGNDSALLQAARVSYGAGTKSHREDQELINYLVRHRHTSPIEMVEFKFHCKMPIFIARQWIRHRTASVNEYSARYSEIMDDFYIPDPDKIGIQSKTNKQGREQKSESPLTFAHNWVVETESDGKRAYEKYKVALQNGIPRELARINLPINTYTQWYWKIDLHNLLHFLNLRLDSHAQYEIRVYAEAIAQLIKDIVPMTWGAFEDYVINAMTFSRKELDHLSQFINITAVESMGVSGEVPSAFSKGEWAEFKKKLSQL